MNSPPRFSVGAGGGRLKLSKLFRYKGFASWKLELLTEPI